MPANGVDSGRLESRVGKSAEIKAEKKKKVLEATVWVEFEGGKKKNRLGLSVPTGERGSGCGRSRTADGP